MAIDRSPEAPCLAIDFNIVLNLKRIIYYVIIFVIFTSNVLPNEK